MLKQFFNDKKGKLSIVQVPNIPLGVWIIATLLAKITNGTIKNGFLALATASLFTWAYLEIKAGVSPIRRTLVVIVIVMIVVHFFR